MKQHRTSLAACLSLVLLLLLGCSSGSSTNIGTDNQGSAGPEPGINLPPSASPDEAVVDAVVNVVDYRVVDEPGPEHGTSAASVNPGGSGMQIMAKIIQPGDDILSEKIVRPGTRFKLSVGGGRASSTTALTTALQVKFRVVEDLDGDGEGEDLITQTVPLSLIAGKVAKVDLSFRRARLGDVATGGGTPTPGSELGELVYASAERQDALGSKDDFFGINFATGEVLFDVDGNEFLAPGDDQVLVDENMNGWPDDTEESYFDPQVNQPSAPPALASGMITAVDLAGYAFDMQTTDGRKLRVTLDPYALIAPLSADGSLLGQVVLEPAMVGRDVEVDGIPLSSSSMIALRVILLPAKAPR